MKASIVPSELTDEQLVSSTLAERDDFVYLVERYEDKLGRYIRRLGIHNLEDIEDTLQETFIKVYKNLNGYDASLPFSSWIYRIAHNEAISFYRKRKVRPEGHLVAGSDELLLWQADTDSQLPDTLYDTEVDAQLLNQSLAKLPAKYRNPLILRYFEYKEYEEISDILKIPIGSVGTLIHRGKKQLQTDLLANRPPNS